jgi:hypothetical protein
MTGSYLGYDYWRKSDGASGYYYIFYSTADSRWELSTVLGGGIAADHNSSLYPWNSGWIGITVSLGVC